MTPGGGFRQAHAAGTPPVSGTKHGLVHFGPPLSKFSKTSVPETEAGRAPLQISPDDSKALDFDEPKIESIRDKRQSTSGTTEYLLKWEGHGQVAWNPAQSLAGSMELLIRFEERLAAKARNLPSQTAANAAQSRRASLCTGTR